VSVKYRRLVTGAGAAIALVAAQLSLSVTPAYAAAGTVSVSGSTLTFTAEAGYSSTIVIDFFPVQGRFKVSDSVAPLKPVAPQCWTEQSWVLCDGAGVTIVEAHANDGNDTLGVRGTLGNVNVFASGGSGKDKLWLDIVGAGTLYGGTENDILLGSLGNDRLYGEMGNDSLSGGSGNDLLVGGPGNDSMSGGLGTDTVSYADHTDSVTADIDIERGDDGSPGEQDTIQPDVEKILGGRGNDTLTGSDADNELTGGPGDDALIGGLGSDLLSGESGFDKLYGDGVPPSGERVDADVCALGSGGGWTVDCEVVV